MAAKKSKSSALRVDPYLEGLMAKLTDRLGALERKLDTVIAQTAGRGSGPSQLSRPVQQNYSNPHPMVEPKHPSRHERVMYEAVCADCQDPCEVPFRPSPERAIYCKPCFAKRKSGGGGRVQPNPSSASPAQSTQPFGRLATAVATTPAAVAKKSKPAAPAKKAKKKK